MPISVYGRTGPVIKIFNTDGLTTLKTYYLPNPNKKDGFNLTWENLAQMKKRLDGTTVPVYADSSKRYIPHLTIKYSHYRDYVANGTHSIGSSDSNTPSWEQLVKDLATYAVGRLAISPGGSSSYFRCNLVKNLELKPINTIAYTDITLEFVGLDAYPSMDLNSMPTPGDIVIPGTPSFLQSLGVNSPLTSSGGVNPVLGLSYTPANKAGDAFTGNVYFNSSYIQVGTSFSGGAQITLNAAVATNKYLNFASAGITRWNLFSDNSAESGSDNGSNLYISSYTDLGATIDYPISIIRKAGGAISIGGSNRPTTFTGSISTNSYSNVRTNPNACGFQLQTAAGVGRWINYLANVESGSNGGSDWGLGWYNDAGVYQGTYLTVIRSTGNINASGTLTANKLNTATQNTWTKAQIEAQVTLTPGTTVNVDASLSSTFTLTAAQSFTLANPINGVAGQNITIVLKQDTTGSRVITWGSAYKFPSGANKILSTAASSIDVVTAYFDGSNYLCNLTKAYS
jgi:hypothetical protein